MVWFCLGVFTDHSASVQVQQSLYLRAAEVGSLAQVLNYLLVCLLASAAHRLCQPDLCIHDQVGTKP